MKRKGVALYAAFLFLLALCAAVFAATAIRLYGTWQSYEAAYYAQIARAVADVTVDDAPTRPPLPEEAAPAVLVEEEAEAVVEPEPLLDVFPEDAAPIVIDFDALQAVNSDVVGWLYCPGTSISFPILETTERDKHPGCVFSVTPFLQTSNTVIYGPTAEDGGAFGALLGYREQAFYDEHPEIWLLTPEENHRIHLLGGGEIPADDPFFSPSGRVDAENQMLRIMENSTFSAPAHLRGHLVTLAASAEESSPSRFVVFGLTK